MRQTVRTEVGFFFSSRRRHTRFDCDWSSDVCSSDLQVAIGQGDTFPGGFLLCLLDVQVADLVADPARSRMERRPYRSEERRVGKEGRPRTSPSRQQRTKI